MLTEVVELSFPAPREAQTPQAGYGTNPQPGHKPNAHMSIQERSATQRTATPAAVSLNTKVRGRGRIGSSYWIFRTYLTGYFRSFFMKLTSSRFLMPYLKRELYCYTPVSQEPQPLKSYSLLFPRGRQTPTITCCALMQRKLKFSLVYVKHAASTEGSPHLPF